MEDNGVASLKDNGVALLKDDRVSEKMKMLTSNVLIGAKRPKLEEITPPVDGSENAQDVHAGRQEIKKYNYICQSLMTASFLHYWM